MKTRIIVLVVLLLIGTLARGQFLKKLGDRVQNAAERTVLNKADQEASKQTDQALDKVFDMDLGAMGTSNIDPSTLPSSYEFDWQYTLEMTNKKGNLKMHYFLPEDGGPFGSRPEMDQGETAMNNMMMVMDPELSTTTILMDNGGQKTGIIMSNPDLAKEISEANDMNAYDFKEIGTKEILGYTCQGFQMDSEDATIIVYMAFDAPVSFNKMYSGNNAKQLPKGFDPKWLDKLGENSLMMEMDFQNKKQPNQSTKMTCIDLKKEPFAINTSEYQFNQIQGQ